MFLSKRVLALIPARGGSKGIKDKNITLLAGKPLIAYTILAALKSKYIDKVVVTTDDERIAQVSLSYGAEVPFMRPSELAQDNSKTIDVVVHALNTLKHSNEHFDAVVLLQPTQPLRNDKDIDAAIESFYESGRKSLVSISEVDDHPLLIRQIDESGRLKKLLNVSSTCRRQDMPKYYRVNGCIYINAIEEVSPVTSFNDNEIPYVMPKSRSVDIDENKDLILADLYLKSSTN